MSLLIEESLKLSGFLAIQSPYTPILVANEDDIILTVLEPEEEIKLENEKLLLVAAEMKV